MTDSAARVSIHARHYWRARPWAVPIDLLANPFQSTPAITGGRDNQQGVLDVNRLCFNPRPPLLAGETRAWGPHGAGDRGFNPRPPLLAGETYTSSQNDPVTCVSIHARHYWRARPRIHAGGRQSADVSIHARHYWRARPISTQRGVNLSPFQSTPAITGGRDMGGHGWAVLLWVSIHARHYCRARPEQRLGDLRRSTVSIHARHYWRARLK